MMSAPVLLQGVLLMPLPKRQEDDTGKPGGDERDARPALPLPNYTLSSICPACGAETFKLACKVRCGRCGFVWDCSEL